MILKYMPPLLRRSSRLSMHNLWALSQRNPQKTQVASLVHVTTMQQSDPNQIFGLRKLHRHPSAHQIGKKTYDIDVLLAEDDDAADVCWTFQIEEGEDLLDRLLAYAQAFGKHGSGNKSYDKYVRAFQSTMTGLYMRRLCDKEGLVIKDMDEDDDQEIKKQDEDVHLDMEDVEEDGCPPGFAEKASDWNKENEKK